MGNMVKEIHALTSQVYWRHVPGSLNLATLHQEDVHMYTIQVTAAQMMEGSFMVTCHPPVAQRCSAY